MTTVVKAEGPADFLAMLPALAGYVPEESVVIVPFHHTRTVGVLRYDLSLALLDSTDQLVATVEQHAPDAASVVIVAYTHARADEAHDVTSVLAAAFQLAGVQVRDVLVVFDEGWFQTQIPADVHPLSEITDSPSCALSLPYLGLNQTSGAALPPVTDDFCEEVDGLRGMALDRWEVDPSLRDAPTVAAVLDAIADPRQHDALLRALIRVPADASDGFMLGQTDYRPTPETLTHAHELTMLAASVETTPGTLSIAAWCAWARGLGSIAGALIDRGLELEPAHAMLTILDTFIGSGILPQWAIAQRPA